MNRNSILWSLTGLIAAGWLVTAFADDVRTVVILIEVGFAVVHGTWRYGGKAIAAFLIPGFVISNIMENLSITTGFPFGDYHYTGSGKLFLVPWFIGPAYLATGYLAWIVATVIVGDIHRGSSRLSTVSTPVIAAFVMTSWDLAIDPSAATINRAWIWEHGGGFFGVPLGNYLGWTLTVYLFMQVFALYLRRRGPEPWAPPSAASDLQAVIPYATTAIVLIGNFLSGTHKTVTDATGARWHTADIYETQALLVIYGMGFLSLLAVLIIAQRSTGDSASRHDLAHRSPG
ncbi:MAG: carotenoid biosynthesis protein [Marmoricola sp.]